MKIWCQLPICMPKDVYGKYYDLLMQDYNLFKDKETEVTIKDVPTGITVSVAVPPIQFFDA